ncbi:MAG: hypothetical protein K0S71_1782 [Clostridia bacterium]|jgi:hypothetical protein|nr:hypothetical protein [Clostridia bacterium]
MKNKASEKSEVFMFHYCHKEVTMIYKKCNISYNLNKNRLSNNINLLQKKEEKSEKNTFYNNSIFPSNGFLCSTCAGGSTQAGY